MNISNISILTSNKTATLSADIVFKGNKQQTIYFRVPEQYKAYMYVDATPFLAAVLLPCMKTKEDITIEGHVSQKLLDNTTKIMDLVSSWDIGLHKISINVIARSLSNPAFQQAEGRPDLSAEVHNNKKEACFFSGGVDSFYTYLKHKKTISHFILVHGFDVPLQNTSFFKTITQQIEDIVKDEKKELITLETNIKDIIEPKLVWDFGHGGALAAVALFLRNGLKKVYISGAVRKDELFPYGTHPHLDSLWSSETLEIVHEGTEHNRLGKVMTTISKSPIALKHLRVCTQNMKGKYNCSQCYKCLQTMIELICANAFDKAETFHHPIDLEAVRHMYYNYKLKYNFQGEANLEILENENREPELQQAIKDSLQRSKQFSFKRELMHLAARVDQTYFNRRFYRLIFTINNQQDRNIIFKFLSKQGVLK